MKNSELTEEEKKLDENYKKMSQHEHVLARPDTYIGSIEIRKNNEYVYVEEDNNEEDNNNKEKGKIKLKEI